MRNLFDLAGVPFRGNLPLSRAVRQIIFNDVGNIGKYQIKHVVIDHIGTPVIYEYIDVLIPLTADAIITTYRNAKELKETGNYFNDMRYLYLLEGVPIRGNSNSPYVRQILLDDASNIGKTQIKRVNYETGELEDLHLNRPVTVQDIINMYAGAVQLVRDSYIFNTIRKMSQLAGVPFRGDIENSPILRQIIFDLVTMTGNGLLEVINPFGTFDIAAKATLGELMQMIRGLGILFDNYIEPNRETLGVILNGDTYPIETYRGRRALDIQKWMELIAMVGVGENKYFVDAYQLGKALLHVPEIINVLEKQLGYTLDPAHNPMHMRLLMLNIGGVYYGSTIGNEKIVSFYNDEAAYNRISFGKITPVPFKGYIKLIDSDIVFARFTNEIRDGKIQMTLEYIDGNLEDWFTTDKVILTEKRVYDIRTSNLEMAVIPVDSRHFWLMEYDQNQTDNSYYSLATNEDDIGKTYQFFRVPASSRMFWCDALTFQKTLFASGTVTGLDTKAGELTQTIFYYIGKGNINNTQKQVIDLNSTTGRAKKVDIQYPNNATTVSSTNYNGLFFGPFALLTNNVESTGYHSSTELKTRTIGEIHIPELVEENGRLVFVGTRTDETGTYTVHINPRLLGAETQVIDNRTNSTTVNSDFFGNIAGKSVYREINGYSETRYLKMGTSGVPVFVDGLLEMESEDDLGLSFEMKLAPAHFGAAVWVKNKATKAETEFEKDKFYGPVGLCATYREFLNNGKVGYWQETYLGEKPTFDAGNITNVQIIDNLGNNQTAIIDPHHFGLSVSISDEEGAITENLVFYGRAIIDSKYSLGGYIRTMKAKMETEAKPVFENAVLNTVVSDEIIPALNMKIDLNHLGAPVESYNPVTGALVKYVLPYGPMALQSIEQDGLKVTVSEIRRDDDGNPLRTDMQDKNNLFINDITVDFGPAKSVINREVYSDLKGRNWFGKDDDGTELTYLKHFGPYSTLIQGINGGLRWEESAGDKPEVATYNPLNQGEVRAYQAHYSDYRGVSKDIYRDVNRGDNVIEILGDRRTETIYDYKTLTTHSQTRDTKIGELISDATATFDFLNRYWDKSSVVNYDENNILRKEAYCISPYGKTLYGRMGKEDFVPEYNGYLETGRNIYKDGELQRRYVIASWKDGEATINVTDYIKNIDLSIIHDIYGRAKEITQLFPGLTARTVINYHSATERPDNVLKYYNGAKRFSVIYGKPTTSGTVAVTAYNYVHPNAGPVKQDTKDLPISDDYYICYEKAFWVDKYGESRTILPETWHGVVDRLKTGTEYNLGIPDFSIKTEVVNEVSEDNPEGLPLTIVTKDFITPEEKSVTPKIIYNSNTRRYSIGMPDTTKGEAEYYIKGVCLPVDVGEKYPLYIAKMEEAALNTGKLYMDFDAPYEDFRMFDAFTKAGINLILIFDFDEASTKEYFISKVVEYVNRYNKHYPQGQGPVFMWGIGNEENYSDRFKDDPNAWSDILKSTTLKTKDMGPDAWLDILQSTAQAIKAIDPVHLVTTAHGNLPLVNTPYGDIVDKDFIAKVSAIDIWGINMYKWVFPEQFFYRWNRMNEKFDAQDRKAFWVSETGLDAFNDKLDMPIDNPQDGLKFGTQAFGIDVLYQHIERARKYHSGTCWFELADEYWKAKDNGIQDNKGAGQANEGIYPDLFANEEWFGLCKWDNGLLVNRPAFEVLRDYYTNRKPLPSVPQGRPFARDAYYTDTEVIYWHEDFEGQRTYYDISDYAGIMIPLYGVDMNKERGIRYAINGKVIENVIKIYDHPQFGFYDKTELWQPFNHNKKGIPAIKIEVYDYSCADVDGEPMRWRGEIYDIYGRLPYRVIGSIKQKKTHPTTPTSKPVQPTQQLKLPYTIPQPPKKISWWEKILNWFVGKAGAQTVPGNLPGPQKNQNKPRPRIVRLDSLIALGKDSTAVDRVEYPQGPGEQTGTETIALGEGELSSGAYQAVPYDISENPNWEECIKNIRKYLIENNLADELSRFKSAKAVRIRPIKELENMEPTELKDWISFIDKKGYDVIQLNFAQERFRVILRMKSNEELGSIDCRWRGCEVGELLGVGISLGEFVTEPLTIGSLHKEKFLAKKYLVRNAKTHNYFIELRNKADFGIIEQKYDGDYTGDLVLDVQLLQHIDRDNKAIRTAILGNFKDALKYRSTEIMFYDNFIGLDMTRYLREYLRLNEIPETNISFITDEKGEIIPLWFQGELINPLRGEGFTAENTGAISISRLYDIVVLPGKTIAGKQTKELRIYSLRHDELPVFNTDISDEFPAEVLLKSHKVEVKDLRGRQLEKIWVHIDKNGKPYNLPGDLKAYSIYDDNGEYGQNDLPDYSLTMVIEKNKQGVLTETIFMFSKTTRLYNNGSLRYSIIEGRGLIRGGSSIPLLTKEGKYQSNYDLVKNNIPNIYWEASEDKLAYIIDSWEQITDKNGKLYAMLTGHNYIDPVTGFVQGDPTWIDFFNYRIGGVATIESGLFHQGIPSEGLTYSYKKTLQDKNDPLGLDASKYIGKDKLIAHSYSIKFHKDGFITYDNKETRENKRDIVRATYRQDGRLYSQISRDNYGALRWRPFVYYEKKINYDAFGIARETEILNNGLNRLTDWTNLRFCSDMMTGKKFDHLTVMFHDKPGYMLVFDIDRNNGSVIDWVNRHLNGEYIGYEFRSINSIVIFAKEGQLPEQVLLDGKVELSNGTTYVFERGAQLLVRGEIIKERKSKFTPVLHRQYKEREFFSKIREYFTIHFTEHKYNNWLYNLFRPGTLVPLLITAAIGFLAIWILLPLALYGATGRLSKKYFRRGLGKKGVTYKGKTERNYVKPVYQSGLKAQDARVRLSFINRHLYLIGPYQDYLMNLYTQRPIDLLNKYYPLGHPARAIVEGEITSGGKSDIALIEEYFVKPIVDLFLAIITDQYEKLQKEKIGQRLDLIKKLIIENSWEKDYFIFDDRDALRRLFKYFDDPVIQFKINEHMGVDNEKFGLSRLLSSDKNYKKNVEFLIHPMRQALRKKYQDKKLKKVIFPTLLEKFAQNKFVKLGIPLVFSVSAVSIAIFFWSLGIGPALFIAFAVSFTIYELIQLLPFLIQVHLGHWIRSLYRIWKTKKIYNGPLSGESLKIRKQSFYRYFRYLAVYGIFILALSVFFSLGTIPLWAFGVGLIIVLFSIRESMRSWWYLFKESEAAAIEKTQGWDLIKDYSKIGEKELARVKRADSYFYFAYKSLVKETLLRYHLVTLVQSQELLRWSLPKDLDPQAKEEIKKFFNKIETVIVKFGGEERFYRYLDQININKMPIIFKGTGKKRIIPSVQFLDGEVLDPLAKTKMVPQKVIKSGFRIFKENFAGSWKIFLKEGLLKDSGLLDKMDEASIQEFIEKFSGPIISLRNTIDQITEIINKSGMPVTVEQIQDKIVKEWIIYRADGYLKTLLFAEKSGEEALKVLLS
jgi:hypothetical protein